MALTKSNSLTTEETIKLFRDYQSADSAQKKEDIMTRIMQGNDALVMSILQRYFSTYANNTSMEDMMQAGRLGLYEALLSWDPDRGKLSTHATFYIQHEMYEYAGIMSNISTYYQSQIKKFNKAVATLSLRGITKPSATDMADEMGIGIEAVLRISEMMGRTYISMEEQEAVGAYAADTRISPEDSAIENEEREILIESLKLLNQEETAVVNELFRYDEMYGTDRPDTLVNIGRKLNGKKPDEVKRIRQRAIRILENAMRNAGYGSASQDPYNEFANNIPINFSSANKTAADEINVINF
jgi:RNA polymerase sigma factor (sigma-70 family)